MSWKRPLALLTAFVAFGLTKVFAETIVDPVLNGAVTWTAAGGPYHLNHDTLLPAGSRLVISPGTVVVVSTGEDQTIPQVSPQVDFVIQGQLIMLGTETDPVKIVPSQPTASWGALYVASNAVQTWRYANIEKGRLVVVQTALNLENCRMTRGGGLQAGARAEIQLIDCQLDENKIALYLWDPSARVNLIRTRLWLNETSISFRSKGTLTATGSSVTDSKEWAVVNGTEGEVQVPVLWWGTKDSNQVAKKIMDGRRRTGLGIVYLEGVADRDPFLTAVQGFDPGKDPRKRYWRGPKYLVGLYAHWMMPSLNMPNAPFKASLGFGGTMGIVVSPPFEFRLLVQTASLSADIPEKLSYTDINILQFGVMGRYPFYLKKKGSLAIFTQAGALMSMTKQTATHPTFPDDLTSPPVTDTGKETNLGLSVGMGLQRRIGKWHQTEVGVHYAPLPLSGGRGGTLLQLRGGLSLYFG